MTVHPGRPRHAPNGCCRSCCPRLCTATRSWGTCTRRTGRWLPGFHSLAEKTIGLQYVAAVMAVFAALALILAVLGLYAVMTYLVAQRVREIGVRMALGATRSDVTRLTLRQAARLTIVGVAVGLALALALGRAMEAGLLGIVSSDARLTTALALVLGVTALAASYLPARRAASIDPIVALRNE